LNSGQMTATAAGASVQVNAGLLKSTGTLAGQVALNGPQLDLNNNPANLTVTLLATSQFNSSLAGSTVTSACTLTVVPSAYGSQWDVVGNIQIDGTFKVSPNASNSLLVHVS